MNLRPYHNPESVDESRVPDGWRFLYADEAGKYQHGPCSVWQPMLDQFCSDEEYTGTNEILTYIVPVNA